MVAEIVDGWELGGKGTQDITDVVKGDQGIFLLRRGGAGSASSVVGFLSTRSASSRW